MREHNLHGAEQDPSVYLSGFHLAVRLGGLFGREDLGVKVDEAGADGFEGAFGGGPGQLGVGREVRADAEAEDREVGDPEPVGLHAVLPIAVGVADGQQSPERSHDVQAGGSQIAAHGVDHHTKSFVYERIGELIAGDHLVIRQSRRHSAREAGRAHGADNGRGAEAASDPGKGGRQPAECAVHENGLVRLEVRDGVSARYAVATLGTVATARAGSGVSWQG